MKKSAMSYREEQRKRAIEIRGTLLRDPGSGMFYGKERDFVLEDASLNLWDGIREDAKAYFNRCGISWWNGNGHDPTGHLLSSQIACLNHLYFVRQRRDVATAILHKVLPTITEALPIDGGFVEFEYIGKTQYLKERGFTRGRNCTSIDAVMLGITRENETVLFLIEWKYTETYEPANLYIPERSKVYDHFIKNPDGPFINGVEPKWFYYEPFYQMMRQTLLGSLFVVNREMGCNQCVNIHVIPNGNVELKGSITSPMLSGKDIHEAWGRVLKQPSSYIPIDPKDLLDGAASLPDTKSWLSYLHDRYW